MRKRGIPPDAGRQKPEAQPKGSIELVELKTLDAGIAHQINNSGQVAGVCWSSQDIDKNRPTARGFLWEKGKITNLGTLAEAKTEAWGINNLGHVVGFSRVGDWMHGCLWKDGTMSDLGTMGGLACRTEDINDSGWIVGRIAIEPDVFHAFVWRDGEVTDLGKGLAGSSWAHAINNTEQVVGHLRDSAGAFHACLWDHGEFHDLGTLGGRSSVATGINDEGTIIGWSDGGWWPGPFAFLWANGQMSGLGFLPGAYSSSSIATSINSLGQVVGATPADPQEAAGPSLRAFIWNPAVASDPSLFGETWATAKMSPLGPPETTTVANSINDQGQVAGGLADEHGHRPAVWT